MRPHPLLGEFDLYVLLTILRLRDDAYGVSIAEELQQLRPARTSISAVYAALDRLETSGFVTGILGEATPERGGRAKRFFRVTGEGVSTLRETRSALGRLWRHLPAEQSYGKGPA